MVDEFSSFARLPKPNFRMEVALDLVRQSLFLQEVAHQKIDFVLDADTSLDFALSCDRSVERRVGKACVSTCRSRWSPYHYKKNKITYSLHQYLTNNVRQPKKPHNTITK